MGSIMTNGGAMQALAVLRSVSAETAAVQQRVSSGLRVGSAREDAAFWSVSMTIRSDISVMRIVADNLSVASAQLGLARGTSETVSDLMARIRATAAYLEPDTPTDKAKFAREIEGMLAQIGGLVSEGGGFNGVNLLDGNRRHAVIGDGTRTMAIGGHRLAADTLGIADIRAALGEVVALAGAARPSDSAGLAHITGTVATAPALAGGQVVNLAPGDGINNNSLDAVLASSGLTDHEKMLIWGTKWGNSPVGTGVTLTFSFHNAQSQYGGAYDPGQPMDDALTGAYELNNDVKEAVRRALAAWSAVANIVFVEVVDDGTVAGDLRFGGNTDAGNPTAYAVPPHMDPAGGDVWFGASYAAANAGQVAEGSYGYLTVLHEIGHALGLKHPHDDNVYNGNNYDGAENDHLLWSVMSYRDFEGDALDGYSHVRFPTSPMVADIAAMQYLYGANNTHNAGDTIYRWGTGDALYQTIWDSGGFDTIDWSNQTTAAVIDLRSGTYSQLGPPVTWLPNGSSPFTLGIAGGVIIERAVGGAGDDTLIGNDHDNVFIGNGGNDTIDGGGGFNVAVFRGGRSSYTIDYLDDGQIRVAGPDGSNLLTRIQRLLFDDGAVDLGALVADKVRRLAESGLNRAIEAATTFGTQEAALRVHQDIVLAQITQKTVALGVLVDADMSIESARLQALQVQSHLATQSLAIANRMPQSILELFRAA